MDYLSIQPHNIAFQKKLVAKATIQKDYDSEEVKIYHLDEEKDINDLKRASNQENWYGSFYIDEICDEGVYFINNYTVYTMETKDKNVICYSVVDNNRKKETRLNFIETAPKLSCYNKTKRGFKYVGETMMAFIAKQGKKKDFVVGTVADREKTKGFYFKNCKFTPYKTNGAILEQAKLDKFVKNNASHTGKEVELI